MQDRFEEIKNSFLPRFWDTENKNMSYPYWNIYSNNFFYPYDKSTEKDSCDDWDDIWLSDILINPRFIRMRPTGLKDKNGKLIYEGDIVDVFYNGSKVGRYLYKWESPAFYVEPFENDKQTGSHWAYFAVAHERCEIIGNIYENPELLGGAK